MNKYQTNEWARQCMIANVIGGGDGRSIDGQQDECVMDSAEWLFETYTFEYLADRENYEEMHRVIVDKLEQISTVKRPGKTADYVLTVIYALNEKHGGICK